MSSIGRTPVHGERISSRPESSWSWAIRTEDDAVFFPRHVSGGSVRASVIEHQVGQTQFRHKYLGSRVPVPLVLTFPLGEGLRAFGGWIDTILMQKHGGRRPSELRLDQLNHEGSVVSSRTYFDCELARVEFPLCDTTSTDPMLLTFTVEFDQVRTSASESFTFHGAVDHHVVQASQFRLSIDGLEESCRGVRTVHLEDVVAQHRKVSDEDEPSRTNSPLETTCGSLIVTSFETNHSQFAAFFEDIVIRGNDSSQWERSGKLELLDSDFTKPLVTIELLGLGVFAYGLASDRSNWMQTEFYVTAMDITSPLTG